MKFFCKAGPVRPDDHYYIPSLPRIRTDNILQLIEQKKYFVLHAPRQTGKTSLMLELVKQLNEVGRYHALYVNIESAQAMRADVEKGMAIILEEFLKRIKSQLPQETHIIAYIANLLSTKTITGASLNIMLSEWATHAAKPLVIFIDEIDSLVGDTLISVLRQLRSGYDERPQGFPQSLCLVGVRDVRDYRIWSDAQQQIVLGGSAFNIKDRSLRLPDFTKDEVKQLYLQHTQATGQKFDADAIDYAFQLTQGQPWIINALAYEACFEMVTDRSKPITKDIIETAKETLIKRRDTHIDVLVDRLSEPRIRTIVDAIITGIDTSINFPVDDIQYAIDLGLVARRENSLVISNLIYQEVLPRELTYATQLTMPQQQLWYVRKDGSIDIHKMLTEFTQFYRENSAVWLEKFAYKESGPHLLTMAFLQRVINACPSEPQAEGAGRSRGGKIHREYALGTDRVDLLITWQNQRIVIELKVWYSKAKTIDKGLEQTAGYMDTSGATEGHLVIFDKREDKSWEEKIYTRQERVGNKTITVWGM